METAQVRAVALDGVSSARTTAARRWSTNPPTPCCRARLIAIGELVVNKRRPDQRVQGNRLVQLSILALHRPITDLPKQA
jgi:hypothetical protein